MKIYTSESRQQARAEVETSPAMPGSSRAQFTTASTFEKSDVASEQAAVSPTPASPTHFTDDLVSLRPGQDFILELKSDPSTGFVWSARENTVRPKVLVVDEWRPSRRSGRRVMGGVRITEHFLWSAADIAKAGGKLTVQVASERFDKIERTLRYILVVSGA